MKQKVRLFDPHPGFGGAAVPLPQPIKKVVDELDGQTMYLHEAIRVLDESINQVFEQEENAVIEAQENCILLTVGTFNTTRHCWRLIRHEVVLETIE